MGRRGDVALALFIAVVLGLQVVAIRELDPAEAFPGVLRRVIFLLPVVLIPVLMWRFRSLVGSWLVAIGLLLNLLPMAAHGGLMPVAFERVSQIEARQDLTVDDIGTAIPGSKDVLLWQKDIRFELLSDRFRADSIGPGSALFSAGDAVEMFGIAVATLQLVLFGFCSAALTTAGSRKPTRSG